MSTSHLRYMLCQPLLLFVLRQVRKGFNPNRYQVLRRNNNRDCSDTITTFETYKIKSKQLYPDQKCDVYSKCYTSHKRISPRPFLSPNESLNQPQKKSHSDKLYGEIPHEKPGKYIRPSRFFEPIWPEFPLNTGSAPRPLFMNNSDPRKYYISGYTGHVPRLRFTYGMTYPTATNHALCQFTRENCRQRALDSNPFISYRAKQTKSIKNNVRLPNHVLPFLDTGLIPKYAGHIPGYKFVYGDTFGRATLKLSESRHLPTRKLLQLKF